MLSAYTIIFTLGSLLSLLWLGWDSPASRSPAGKPPALTRIDAGLAALALGIIGARLGFVLAHREYYGSHPEQIPMMWEGGLSWAAGGIAALAALAAFSAITHTSFLALIDAMAIPSSILAFACWFGCLLEGCGYGRAADFGMLTPAMPDIFGGMANRWPVQGLGALLFIFVFLALSALHRRPWAQGALGSLGLIMIASVNLLLSFLRGDPVPSCYEIRLDALASAGLLALALIGLTLLAWKNSAKRSLHAKNHHQSGTDQHEIG